MDEGTQVIIISTTVTLIGALMSLVTTKLWEASLNRQHRSELEDARYRDIQQMLMDRVDRQYSVLTKQDSRAPRDVKPSKTYPKPNQFLIHFLYSKFKKGVYTCLKLMEIL